MIVSIHQPNYLPWLGFFSKMAKSDVFVIFDDVQLPRGGHSYETRAVIQGGTELNVPVESRGELLIKDTRLAPGNWRRKHMRSLELAYPKSPRLSQLDDIYKVDWELLLYFNLAFIRLLAGWLDIKTRIVLSSDLGVHAQGADKIIGIVKALGGDTYISGTGAGSRRYVHEQEFSAQGIRLLWHTYDGPNLSAIHSVFTGERFNGERVEVAS